MHHLELRQRTYYAVLEVPPKLRDVLGRRLRRSLKTRDKQTAKRRRGPKLKELRAEIARARRGGAVAPLGLPGEGSFLTSHLFRWLNAAPHQEREEAKCGSAVKRLELWLATQGVMDALPALGGQQALEFRAALTASGLAAGTVNNMLSCLRRYWEWMQSEGRVDGNPWVGKQLPRPLGASRGTRAFDDDEINAIFAGPLDDEMRDVMLIGALSGLSLEDIFQLRVMDCQNGQFQTKPRGKEREPSKLFRQHSLLRGVIGLRCADKQPTAYLFDVTTAPGWDGCRSSAFAKRFARYLRRLGAARSSGLNFQSFKMWLEAGLRVPPVEQRAASRMLHSGEAMHEALRHAIGLHKEPPTKPRGFTDYAR